MEAQKLPSPVKPKDEPFDFPKIVDKWVEDKLTLDMACETASIRRAESLGIPQAKTEEILDRANRTINLFCGMRTPDSDKVFELVRWKISDREGFGYEVFQGRVRKDLSDLRPPIKFNHD